MGGGIRDATATLDLSVRTGLHCGEIEIMGDDDRGGIAVHASRGTGRRHSAGPGDVLVSRTVKDLVAGSGLEFEDRGEHVLKGVEGARRVFAAL